MVSPLLQSLRNLDSMEEGQRALLSRWLTSNPPANALLINALNQEGNLTRYQAHEILLGRGDHLLLNDTYLLIDVLGQGGMGQIFLAKHLVLGQVRAIKMIRPDALGDPLVVQRFAREMTLAAQLDHPNVVRAFDAGQFHGMHFFVMELIHGRNLSEVVERRGQLPVSQAADYVRQAALGLQYAHEKGLVHRDIKPSNLMLTHEGSVVKILDLGLARLHVGDESKTELTASGQVMGTPDFMAPEQTVNSKRVDIRADIYSLGCTFYYLLTGSVPFPGGNLGAKLVRHCKEKPRAVGTFRNDVPQSLLAVLGHAMRKNPENRIQTPKEVADLLASFCGNPELQQATTPHTPLTGSFTSHSAPSPPAPIPIPVSQSSIPATLAPTTSEQGSRSPGFSRYLLATVGVVLTALALGLWLGRGGDKSGKPPTSGDPNARKQPEANPPPTTILRPIPLDAPKQITNSIGMELRLIPAGTFLMGSPPEEVGRKEDEGPQHEVEITRPFYLGAFEVTQEEHKTVMGNNPSQYFQIMFKPAVGFPVERVSWEDAMEFCRKLSALPEEQKAGRVYRLPTEAEWEYACRGGSEIYQVFAFGNSLSSAQAHFKGTSPYGGAPVGNALGRTVKVGSFKPNGFGLYDTHGNVSEWCLDRYDKDYYSTSPRKDPQGPSDVFAQIHFRRCVRGGSWLFEGAKCRSAARFEHEPDYRISHIGFRVACFLKGKP